MRKLTMDELGRATPQEFKAMEKTPLVLVLDNVRSALNVGSAFRTADAFALTKIVLCGISARPPHREILKTALGATETVEWSYAESPEDAIRELKSEGFLVLAVEQTTGSTPLQDFDVQREGRYAFVFGNEVSGVTESALAVVDGCLEVPQFGTKHSLNIAVCVGITVWDFFKKWRFGEAGD
ncbi:MAG: RNA methyltransferase [Saprospiraceae bacterium]